MISQLDAVAVVDGVHVLDPTSVRVALDEAAAPFAAASIVVEFTPELAEIVDPRDGTPRLVLTLSQRYSGSDPLSAVSELFEGGTLADWSAEFAGQTLVDLTWTFGRVWNGFGYRPTSHRRLDLGIRDRVVDHQAGTITLRATSDESLLIDYGLLASTSVSPTSLTVLSAVQLALGRAIPTATLTTTEGAQTITAESAVWRPGVSAWDYLQPLTAAAGLRLWCDELRVWHLAAPETIVNPGQLTLAATGSVTAATDTVSRDTFEWFDGVVVTYTWTDGSNVRHEQSDVAGEAGATKVQHVQHSRPYPRAGEAAARLRKVRGQGRVLDVSAVANFDAYPSTAASLSVPDTPTQTGYVAAVVWDLPSDEMQVRTRGLTDTPPSSWAFGGVGVAWNDLPVGMSWDEFDWGLVV